MLLDIRKLGAGSKGGEASLDFHCELDLSTLRHWGEAPFEGPVRITGALTGRAGVITLRYTADYTTKALCARCLETVRAQQHYSGEHIVLENTLEEGNEDAYALAPGGILHVDELVCADLSLTLEGVTLCSEQCRGLCQRCGKNLNHGVCGCTSLKTDSRFDALRDIGDL